MLHPTSTWRPALSTNRWHDDEVSDPTVWIAIANLDLRYAKSGTVNVEVDARNRVYGHRYVILTPALAVT